MILIFTILSLHCTILLHSSKTVLSPFSNHGLSPSFELRTTSSLHYNAVFSKLNTRRSFSIEAQFWSVSMTHDSGHSSRCIILPVLKDMMLTCASRDRHLGPSSRYTILVFLSMHDSVILLRDSKISFELQTSCPSYEINALSRKERQLSLA